jgi:hypothetical protein
MTQKQILSAVIGVALAIVVGAVVYRQYTSDTRMNSGNTQKKVMTEKKVAPVPDTVDGVVSSIESETAIDTEALSEEETGTLSEVDADSESVNNLGTSYDENNL